MALPIRVQLWAWATIAVALFVLLWLLGGVLLPFALGAAVAYCLDPLADRLQRLGCRRLTATIIITVVALLAVVALALLVVPVLVEQAVALVQATPELVQDLQVVLTKRFPGLFAEGSTLRGTLGGLGTAIQSRAGGLVNSVLNSAAGLVNVVFLLVVVPFVTFYLLMDWDRMVANIDALLPRDYAPAIRRIAREIDDTLAAFIRGQGTVCLILGTYYAAGLALVGLRFGLVVGFGAGLISFIPYVGAILGGVTALTLAAFQFWGDWLTIVLVAVIFQAGQLVEGNILTPKLVGSSVGLHPVWLIFALSAFGALFGFVGLLVAVPVAAAIGVVARVAVERYMHSRLYLGLSDEEHEA